MITKKGLIIAALTTFCLTITLFVVIPIRSQTAFPYDPWADINDDGKIDMKDIGYVAKLFGTTGTSVAKSAIEYDSGWINIIDKRGQYFNITHNLNITDVTDVIFDITGKESIDSEPNRNEWGPSAFNTTVAGWNQIYEGAAQEYGRSVIQTLDGGYAIVGYTGSWDPLEINVLLVKTDSEGNHLWNKTYGETIVDFGYSVIQTADGGYAIAGYKADGAWLIKTDAKGNHLWNKTYSGGLGGDFGYSVVQTSDGGYAVAGCTWSYGAGSMDFWLIKTDAEGNHLWNKTYGETDVDYDEYGRSVIQTADGGYAIAGDTNHWGAGDQDVWLIKTDSEGKQMWNQTYYSWYHGIEECYSVVQTSDGGYALAGTQQAALLIKTDSEGNQLWNKTYGASTSYSVVQTSDGGYAMAGTKADEAWLIKTDAEGNQLWTQTFGGPAGDFAYSVIQTADGGYAVAGSTGSFGAGDQDVWLIKTYGPGETPLVEQLWLAWTTSTPNTITLYRGKDDIYWNYVSVRIWKTK